jgi:hypothetical protein
MSGLGDAKIQDSSHEEQLLFDVRLTGGREKCRQPVVVGDDLVDLCARLDHTGPAQEERHPMPAVPMVEHGEMVGELLDKLDDLRITDNTIVIKTFRRGAAGESFLCKRLFTGSGCCYTTLICGCKIIT